MAENIVSAVNELIAAVEGAGLEESHATVEQLKLQLQKRDADLARIVPEKENLEKENASLQSQIVECCKELGEKSAELTAVVSERDVLATELGEKSAELAAVASERDLLSTKYEESESESDRFFSDRESLLQEKKELERQVDILLEQLRNVQGDLELYISLSRQQSEMLEESLDFQERAIRSQFNVLSVKGQKLLSPAGS